MMVSHGLDRISVDEMSAIFLAQCERYIQPINQALNIPVHGIFSPMMRPTSVSIIEPGTGSLEGFKDDPHVFPSFLQRRGVSLPKLGSPHDYIYVSSKWDFKNAVLMALDNSLRTCKEEY